MAIHMFFLEIIMIFLEIHGSHIGSSKGKGDHDHRTYIQLIIVT